MGIYFNIYIYENIYFKFEFRAIVFQNKFFDAS